MATVTRELSVAKELVELGEGLVNFLDAVRAALDDGFQIGDDIPALITAALSDLVPALKGAELIKDELQDPETFANAVYVGFSPIAFMFVGNNDGTVTE